MRGRLITAAASALLLTACAPVPVMMAPSELPVRVARVSDLDRKSITVNFLVTAPRNLDSATISCEARDRKGVIVDVERDYLVDAKYGETYSPHVWFYESGSVLLPIDHIECRVGDIRPGLAALRVEAAPPAPKRRVARPTNGYLTVCTGAGASAVCSTEVDGVQVPLPLRDGVGMPFCDALAEPFDPKVGCRIRATPPTVTTVNQTGGVAAAYVGRVEQ